MPMPENLSEAAQRERTRRMLNQKDFELNMGPDGAQFFEFTFPRRVKLERGEQGTREIMMEDED